MDVHTPAARSRNMRAIKGKNTKPELALRKALFAQGYRYRLHDKKLPGRPDIVLPKYRTAIFVHGCFFHGHGCSTFKWPATRAGFWRAKIEGNRARDERQQAKLRELGWQVLVVWECELKGQAANVSRRLRRSL